MSTFVAIFCATAFFLSLVLTHLTRLVALRTGLIDSPDGCRKIQEHSVPLGGGLAILLAYSGTMAIAWPLLSWAVRVGVPWADGLELNTHILAWLFVAALIVVCVGLLDDAVGLRGRQKLMGQVVAASLLICTGFQIRSFTLLGVHADLGPLSIPFTLAWLLGSMNALNLLDGIDGLATTVGTILSATIAVMAFATGKPGIAVAALIFASTLGGFQVLNFPPAKIYLGDAGSMLIGLVLGTLVVPASLKGAGGALLLAAPLAVWAIPFFDSVAAIIRRKLTGRSIYATDRAHLHHRLLLRTGSNARTVIVIGLCCAATCVGGLATVYLKSEFIAIIGILAIVGVLVATRVFGHVELLLLGASVRSMGKSLFLPRSATAEARESAVRLQGNGDWKPLWSTLDRMWNSLKEMSGKLNLRRIQLDVDLPDAHEGFHTAWSLPDQGDPERLWHMEIPISIHRRVIGRLKISGANEVDMSSELLDNLVDLLQPFEMKLSQLISPRHDDLADVAPIAQVAAASDKSPIQTAPAQSTACATGSASAELPTAIPPISRTGF